MPPEGFVPIKQLSDPNTLAPRCQTPGCHRGVKQRNTPERSTGKSGKFCWICLGHTKSKSSLEKSSESSRLRRLDIAQLRRISLGGKCLFCSEDYLLALDFCHINPKDKNIALRIRRNSGGAWRCSEEIWKEEKWKGFAACRNCHVKFDNMVPGFTLDTPDIMYRLEKIRSNLT